MRRNREKGQALVITALALGLFLIGAIGIALDAAQLYAHRHMAQAAADAAAQAAILSIFNGTNVGDNAFATKTDYSHTCAVTDVYTPCSYARKNGFGLTADDTVLVDVPNADDIGIGSGGLSNADPVNLIRVTITRPVSTWFVPLLGGAAAANISASAVAAICMTSKAIPILVLHPNRPDKTKAKDGAFFINGGSGFGKFPIRIEGGPQLSIEVNSESSSSITVKGSSTVSLAKAGPHFTGGNFGSFGTKTYPSTVDYGSTGNWVWPSSPVKDPMYFGKPTPYVAQPTVPANAPATTPIAKADITRYGCPPNITCTLYWPGKYATGINVSGYALFAPGIYYIAAGGFQFGSGTAAAMATGTDAIRAIPAGFTVNHGMLVFNSGNNANNDIFQFGANAGSLKDAAGKPYGITLVGADPGLPYDKILFFEDRTTTVAHTHSLQGGGSITLTGTIYLTNPWTVAHTDFDLYQTLSLGGNSGGTTTLVGEIVTDALEISGDAGIVMQLSSASVPNVRRIALVR